MADKTATGVKFTKNVKLGNRDICSIPNSKNSLTRRQRTFYLRYAFRRFTSISKGSSPYRPLEGASTSRYLPMTSRADDGLCLSPQRMKQPRLELVVKTVAHPDGIFSGRTRCDGGGEIQGRLQQLAESLGTKIKRLAYHRRMLLLNCSFEAIIGMARGLMLSALHLQSELFRDAVKTVVYAPNRTPVDVPDGKAPLGVWMGEPLGALEHMSEFGSIAFRHIEERRRTGKLTSGALMMFLAGYAQRTWRTRCGRWTYLATS